MEFATYQEAARLTSKLPLEGPVATIAPMLGLASETGSILNVYKKYMRDGLDLTANREFLKEELGDLLWYAAAVATACGLKLDDIAQANLLKVQDRYPPPDVASHFASLTLLDQGYPPSERFPRRLVVHFSERNSDDGKVADLTLVQAEPNAFPSGRIAVGDKEIGFTIGGPLGASLTDNSRRADDYRFHDAIHMGFMAVLGWSPTMRSLLRVKRKSNAATDANEDGARAAYAEEGLAAILSRLAPQRTGFRTEASVDGDAIVVVKAATIDLEVEQLPAWLWRRAVSQSFLAMHQLGDKGGGYLVADLDSRTLSYAEVLP